MSSGLKDKSTEELLNSINELDEPEDIELIDINISNTNVYNFMLRYELTSGIHQINKNLLYKLYTKSTVNPIRSSQFKKEVSTLLKDDQSYYYVNFDLNSLVLKLQNDIKRKAKKTDSANKTVMDRFEIFMSASGLANGETLYISTKALYFFFDKWSFNNKRSTLGFYKFTRLLSLYFKTTKNINNVIHYGVDKTKFYEKTNEEDIQKAKDWAGKYKSPKQKKIPSSKPKL